MHKNCKIISKVSLFIFLLILIYMVAGGILPSAIHKQVNEEWKRNWSVEGFYGGKDNCVDRVGIVETSVQALNARLNLLNHAKKEIFICTFSFKPDKSNQEMFSVLWHAANQGVKVRIVADAISAGLDMKKHPMYSAVASHPNVEIKYYNWSKLYKPWTFNGRLHDKIVVVDDRFVVLGGRNSSNYFLGDYNLKSLSYDREIFVYNTENSLENSVIKDVKEYCDTLWNAKVCKPVFTKIKSSIKGQVEQEKEKYETTYELLMKEKKEVMEFSDYMKETVGAKKVSFISNPITIHSKEPLIWYQMIELIKHAKERAVIQTPYAILNREMRDSLRKAGAHLSTFEMLLNSTNGGDNFVACSDYKYSKKKLMKTGVQIYEFEEHHSMHNKSFLIDNEIAVIGSFNLDMRSAYLDTESAIVVHGEEFAGLLEQEMNRMKDCSYVVDANGEVQKNENVVEQKVGVGKEILYYITGFFLQPFRFLL